MATAEWMTVAEVAQLLRVSTRTVQRLVAPSASKNRLLAAKVGGSIRIRRETLLGWLKARERAHAAPRVKAPDSHVEQVDADADGGCRAQGKRDGGDGRAAHH
jgi:excisionase family DNA binding protein